MALSATISPGDWKVFLDGVEVPHQGFQVQFIKNNLSQCSIVLEPDQELIKLRPQTVITIWAKERFPTSDVEQFSDVQKIQNEYYLYWEGISSGITYSKSPESRNITLRGESMFGVWKRTQAFMYGIGSISKSAVLSGSVGVNVNALSGGRDLFSFSQLSTKFTDQTAEDSFRGRLETTVTHLTSLNALLRLQTVRYRLLNNISGIDDNIYEFLLAGVAENLLANSNQQLGETATVLDVINHLQSYGFYSHYEIPCPVPAKLRDSGNVDIATGFGLDELYEIPIFHRRNQLLFLPDTYYVVPPPCNFIFPDHIRSLTVDRDYYSEPTRTLVPDPLIATSQHNFFLAPPNILRNLSDTQRGLFTGLEIFSTTSKAIDPGEEELVSPYQSLVGESRVSLFETTTTQELEKGIVANMDSYQFETLSAFARASETDSEAKDLYQSFITSVVNYRHKIDSFKRNMVIDLQGHRDLVPGFTAAIFDSDISYIASLDAVTFLVDPVGAESCTVTLSKARPLQQLNYEKLDEVYDTVELIVQDLGEALTAAEGLEKQRRDIIQVTARMEAANRIQETLAPVQEDSDIPAPPYFINPELTDLESLDKIYQELIGCQPFYTSDYATDRVPRAFEFLSSPQQLGESAAEFQGLFSYVTAMTAISNVFPIFQTKRFFADSTNLGAETVTSWLEVNQSNNSLGVSSFEWASRNFTKRRRLFMKEYLFQNDLSLQQLYSTGPVTKEFYIQTPTETRGNEDSWDNTIFSKLGDVEASDPIIEELRETAPDFLKTGPRQVKLIDYSRNHFGDRGFDGR